MNARLKRLLATLAVGAVAASVVVSLPIAAPTSAAWTDSAAFGATVTAGSWSTPSAAPVSCAPRDPSVAASCDVVVTRVDNWGTGYRVAFQVSTTSTTPFVWQISLDLSATGGVANDGNAYFPGWPVPAGGTWAQWTPKSFATSNLCATSSAEELPRVTLAGNAAWAATVVAGSPVSAIEFDARPHGTGNIASIRCR